MIYTVYRHYDANGGLLYVGMTANVEKRTYSHRYRARWAHKIARIETVDYEDKLAARIAEREAILTEKPVHNGVIPRDPTEPAAKRNTNREEAAARVKLSRARRKAGVVVVNIGGKIYETTTRIADMIIKDMDEFAAQKAEREAQRKAKIMDGQLKIVCSPTGKETHHALNRDGPRDVWLTECGRAAEAYLEVGPQNVAAFMDSAYSCKRCIRALLR